MVINLFKKETDHPTLYKSWAHDDHRRVISGREKYLIRLAYFSKYIIFIQISVGQQRLYPGGCLTIFWRREFILISN